MNLLLLFCSFYQTEMILNFSSALEFGLAPKLYTFFSNISHQLKNKNCSLRSNKREKSNTIMGIELYERSK